jgi:uncharacterized protein (UPF0332 family)/predicted nucleotidyltransferase
MEGAEASSGTASGSTLGRMPTPAEASLSQVERRVLDGVIDALRAELRGELVAVWLYGSRARGEIVEPEADIDLLVIVRDADRARDRQVTSMVWQAAEAAGGDPYVLSLSVHDPAWVADRRRIEDFFIQNVDRDRVVLAGAPGGDLPGILPFSGYGSPMRAAADMKPRSWQRFEKAMERVAFAERGLEWGDDPSGVVSTAYYGMVYAGSAALSEEDLHPRTHAGHWHEFRRVFVDTDRLGKDVAMMAASARKARQDADYTPAKPDPTTVEITVRDSRRFLEAVGSLLGLELNHL